ncbi:alkaline phosphatase family protein [Roseateles sp. SL47]|uniref:alkaline phosphatase family protein n=1 Tax=Roseateles sp. SL47 TaxID=2995138 RepID=UPI002271B65B|nr:alkaline phosphatase family protein [Roseateles sp. SL47]WAC71678.1 alkaline phosphatase family protein [Roseateles sp. SL47]
MTHGRLLWLLVDGLSLPLLRLLAPRLPPCATTLPLRPLAPNCQTPPSLFSIWSGLPESAHRLTGYDMPVEGHASPLAIREAFANWPQDVAMVWDDWAAGGGQVRTCAVPFVQPQRLAGALLSHSQVYTPALAAPRLLRAGETLVIEALGVQWPVEGHGDSLRLRNTPEGVVDLPLHQTRHLRLSDAVPATVAGHTHRAIALRTVRVEGELRLCMMGFQPVWIEGRDAPQRQAAFRHRAYAALNPARLYADGALGLRLDAGGHGHAETLLLDLLHVVHQSFLEDICWTLDAPGGELVVAYYPVIDLLSHQLLRTMVSPANAAERDVAGQILARVAEWLGELLLSCQRRLAPGSRLVAHADHGMLPIHQEFSLNRWLHQQAWLTLDAEGGIDPQHSLVFYHPAENGWLAVHPERLAAAQLDLSSLIGTLNQWFLDEGPSPSAMTPAFRLIPGPEVSTGQGWQSQWYVQPPDGVRLRADVHRPMLAPARKGGDHTCWSPNPWLEAALLDTEPTGVTWPSTVALTDLAPALLGWLRLRHAGAPAMASTTSTTSTKTEGAAPHACAPAATAPTAPTP